MNHFERFESYVPLRLTELSTWPMAIGVLTFFVAFRYLLMAGLGWWILYRLTPLALKTRQIYPRLPDAKSQWFEIRWSLATSVIFALGGLALGLIWQLGYTKIYLEFDEYPLWQMPLSLLLFSLGHELYFYLTHRLLHLPWLYKHVHYVHHQSLTPSPWASFSFHPVEAVIQAAPLPLLALLIPTHPTMLLFYLTLMTLSAINNHSGFELAPGGRLGRWVGGTLISGLHHAQHHRYFNCNYGLFYTFCDRWFATENPSFPREFSRLTTRPVP